MEEGKKLRGLFVGDLVAPTGFATVMHNIIVPMQEEIDVIGLGVNYRGDPHDFKFPIYPAQANFQGTIYGVERLVNMLNSDPYDFVFILNDAWVISYYLDAIKKHVKKELPKIVVYFPVDSEYHLRHWYRDFDIVSKCFTYTEFGKRVVNEAIPEMEVGIIPHGINSDDFFKLSMGKAEARIKLFGPQIAKVGNPEDLFIVLNANRNQPRKKLDITIEGFKIFAQDKPETVKLYMHSGMQDASIGISTIALRHKIDHRVIITSLNRGVQNVSVSKLNLIYNVCDVGINTSMGEGWGLTNMEHAITGAPQVVVRHSACEELFHDVGLLMEPITNFTFDNSQTVGKLTSPDEVARCLNLLYNDRNLMQDLSTKAIEKFSKPEYQWSVISSQWLEVFKEVCKQCYRHFQVTPESKLNR